MSVSAAQALGLLDDLAAAGVHAVVDGGWGIDALLGAATRPHDDLDLVIDVADLAAARRLLVEAGFTVERDLLPTAIALRHPDGRGADLHPVEPVAGGGGDQVLEDGVRWRYGPPTTGRIGGRAVPCVPPATQLAAHLGYEPDEHDRADVAALCARFGLPLPPAYAAEARWPPA